jgi:hypothetical protein
MSIPVDFNRLLKLKKDYPWPRPDRCANCNNPNLWGHGFVDAFFDCEQFALPLKRYRCPNCGTVIKLKPEGYFKRFRATIDTIQKSISSLASAGKYIAGVTYQRQYLWYSALVRHATARFRLCANLNQVFEKMIAGGKIPVCRTV